MNLTSEETRVLACLVEKSYTTPDQYPLSSNALRSACNQKTSRDPTVDYPLQTVDETMQLLRDAGWARSVRGSGDRAFKHKHVIDEKIGLSAPQQAVWAVLALRGPQSAGELRTRTERYVAFDDPADVERVLEALADSDPPLARNVGRRAGQSQDRWIQLLGESDVQIDAAEAVDGASSRSRVDGPPPTQRPAPRPADDVGLERRVEALERRLAALEAELGVGDAVTDRSTLD